MKPRHVLVATDLSDRARAACHHAATWARASGAKVTLLNVDDLEEFDFPSGLDVSSFRAQVDAMRATKLAAHAKVLQDAGLEVETRVVTGRPSMVVPSEAQACGADLLVLARFGMRSPDQGQPPTLEALLAHTSLPTLIVSPPEDETSGMSVSYRRVMAPTDFSDNSTAGVRAAIALSTLIGASHLNVPHVLRTPFFTELGLPPESLEHLRLSAAEDLDQYMAQFEPGAIELTSTLLLGKSPAVLLTEHAARIQADLVVLPTHGKDAARDLIGHTTREVAAQVETHVLILPRQAS